MALSEHQWLPLAWPAEVNAHEAHALCQWTGAARLLREAEFVALTARWPAAPADGYNLGLRHHSPTPVGLCGPGEVPVRDLYGNVWCWLGEPLTMLPGFAPHPYYPDVSRPYCDGLHPLLRGGSWASSGSYASTYYRNWFRAHFFQHAGLRLARDARPSTDSRRAT